MRWYLRTLAILCSVATVNCGGGGGDPVTFVAILTPFEEARSVARLQDELASWNVTVRGYRCGYMDGSKLPFEQQGGWVDGRTPRFVYVTVDASEAEVARSMRYPGFATIEYEQFRAAHSDPFECDPEKEASRVPFGGAS